MTRTLEVQNALRSVSLIAGIALGTAAQCDEPVQRGMSTSPEQWYFDWQLGYAARETFHFSDNDLILMPLGWTRQLVEGTLRFELSLAARNENFSGQYPGVVSAEALRIWNKDHNGFGLGAQLSYAEDITTAAEIMAGYGAFHGAFGLRAAAGYWGGLDEIRGLDKTQGGVAVAEVTWYPGRNWALRSGLQIEEAGTVTGLAAEVQLGDGPYSISVETAFGSEGYRDQETYDDLTVMIRWSPLAKSPKERDRLLGDRLLHRYVAVQ